MPTTVVSSFQSLPYSAFALQYFGPHTPYLFGGSFTSSTAMRNRRHLSGRFVHLVIITIEATHPRSSSIYELGSNHCRDVSILCTHALKEGKTYDTTFGCRTYHFCCPFVTILTYQPTTVLYHRQPLKRQDDVEWAIKIYKRLFCTIFSWFNGTRRIEQTFRCASRIKRMMNFNVKWVLFILP